MAQSQKLWEEREEAHKEIAEHERNNPYRVISKAEMLVDSFEEIQLGKAV
jgi:hypothetical protein